MLKFLFLFTLFASSLFAKSNDVKAFIVFSHPLGQWSDGILKGLRTSLKNRGMIGVQIPIQIPTSMEKDLYQQCMSFLKELTSFKY